MQAVGGDLAKQDGDGEPAAALTESAKHHEPPATPFFDEVEADEGGGEVGHCIYGGEEAGGGTGEADRLGKDIGEVVAYYVDARQLLHRLRADAKDESEVGFGVAFDVRGLLLYNGLFDFFEILFHVEEVSGAGVIEGDHDLEGFFVPFLGDQPAGGFREPEGGEVDYEDEEELEAQGEAPCELGVKEAEEIWSCVRDVYLDAAEAGLQVIQHEIARPPIFTTINAIPVLPRLEVLLVSEAQTGAVAVFIPFPMPAMTLSRRVQPKFRAL